MANQKKLIMAAMRQAQALRAPVPQKVLRNSVNHLTEEALVKLPGMGAATARAIVAGRPWKDLKSIAGEVRGVTLAKLAAWDLSCD